ncbi:MAG TPA: hypothetical protein VJ765_08540 [Chitinophagaceae bacterium]|nr:hypothetical protein [Chitinophagaceae bacterium]
MKIIIIAALLQFATVYSFGQSGVRPTLKDSKWKGHIEAPQSMDIILDFRNDTLVVTSTDMTELETMFFSQKGDTVNLRKLIGTSPCNDGHPDFQIKDEKGFEKKQMHH